MGPVILVGVVMFLAVLVPKWLRRKLQVTKARQLPEPLFVPGYSFLLSLFSAPRIT